MLQGFVSSTGAPPVVQWKLYSGPGTATFGNTGATNTSVNFSAPGVYTLLLSGDDHIHAVAYDAVIVTVTQTINLTIARAGTNVVLNWTGGQPPYTVQRMDALQGSWTNVISTNGQSLRLPIAGTAACFRVSGP
jgi:hypothetical protein